MGGMEDRSRPLEEKSCQQETKTFRGLKYTLKMEISLSRNQIESKRRMLREVIEIDRSDNYKGLVNGKYLMGPKRTYMPKKRRIGGKLKKIG